MTDCLNDWINVNNVTILFSLWTYTAASMSRSWKMRDTIYVHWFAWLTSQSESSPPTLIRNSQSVNWVLIRADLKVQATIGLGCYCITLGSHPDFQFHHIQLSVFLFFFIEKREERMIGWRGVTVSDWDLCLGSPPHLCLMVTISICTLCMIRNDYQSKQSQHICQTWNYEYANMDSSWVHAC